MLKTLRNNILLALLVLLSSNVHLSAKSLPYPDENLTDVQLDAVMSIITNFILSDEGATEDVTAPVFTSSSSVTVAENQTSAVSVLTTDASSVSYTITGGDSADFSINSSTGIISFNTAPDFETRDTYSFTVTATDSSGNVSSQTVIIHILDVPESALKKTGQTKSYDASGAEVLDNSIKDDGFYEIGVDPSYTRDDATNIVTDHITGLEWQDDAEAKSITKNWADAQTYCSALALDEGGWRLPTRKELVGLSDYASDSPAINPMFVNTVSNYYWSSTTHAIGSSSYAWVVDFSHGVQYFFNKLNRTNRYVRCVRAGQ